MFQNPDFILFGIFVLVFLYIFNFRLQKDGFDFEGFFDFLVIGTVFSVVVLLLTNSWLQNLTIYNPQSIFLRPTPGVTRIFTVFGTYFGCLGIFTKYKNWSVYRVLDVLLMTLLVALSATSLFLPFFYKYYYGFLWGAGGLGMYYLLNSAKDRFIPAGFISSLVLMLLPIVLYGYTKNPFDAFYLGIFALYGLGIFYARLKNHGRFLTKSD